MSKYDPLGRRLQSLTSDKWLATFSKIESLLRFSLPESARKYQAWWSNNKQGSRHTGAWLDVGWRTEDLNLAGERVTFRRSAEPASGSRDERKRGLQFENDAKAEARLFAWDTANEEEVRLGWKWSPLGKVMLDERGRLSFPKASGDPAIYRIRIRIAGKESRYVGETDNLARRFGNYRNPGPSQQTSLRINGILKKALDTGAEISVAVVQTNAWIDGQIERQPADSFIKDRSMPI